MIIPSVSFKLCHCEETVPVKAFIITLLCIDHPKMLCLSLAVHIMCPLRNLPASCAEVWERTIKAGIRHLRSEYLPDLRPRRIDDRGWM